VGNPVLWCRPEDVRRFIAAVWENRILNRAETLAQLLMAQPPGPHSVNIDGQFNDARLVLPWRPQRCMCAVGRPLQSDDLLTLMEKHL
jgi:hypothetical protein